MKNPDFIFSVEHDHEMKDMNLGINHPIIMVVTCKGQLISKQIFVL